MEKSTLTGLVLAVRKAARPIRQNFRKPVHSWTKADGTPLTAIDLSVHQQLKLYAADNGLGYIGEEGDQFDPTTQTDVLYVDPLDGTGAYRRGLFATCVASVMNKGDAGLWYPQMAVIEDPIGGQTWCAEEGKKVYAIKRNGIRTLFDRDLTLRPLLAPYRVTAVAWRNAPNNMEVIKAELSRLPRFDHQSYGSTALGAGLITSGLMDAVLFGGHSAVETAAMMLLVKQVGGVATDLGGTPLTGFELRKTDGKFDFHLPRGVIIASGQELADDLVEVIRSV